MYILLLFDKRFIVSFGKQRFPCPGVVFDRKEQTEITEELYAIRMAKISTIKLFHSFFAVKTTTADYNVSVHERASS